MKAQVVSLSVLLLAVPAALAAQPSLPPPADDDQVAVVLGTQTEMLWPYTAAGETYDPDSLVPGPSDPVNLVFLDTDPREVRQALMELDGNRAGYGVFALINCTWSDAMGYEQAAWAATEGWVGGDVQLQCGSFGPNPRFHLRLFRQGTYTLGAAHFEVQIPNTAEHEVLHWEFAEALVKVDMLRTLQLTGPPTSVVLGPPGTFRTIRHQVYNGLLLNPQLKALLQALGMPDTPQQAPVPIPTDGQATVFAPDILFAPVQAKLTSRLSVTYNVVAPKPFCASPADYILIQEGPLEMELTVHTNPSGYYSRTYDVDGVLDVTPWDPIANQPIGDTVEAIISESHSAMLTDHYSEAHELLLQTLLADPVQSRTWSLDVGHSDRFSRLDDCGVPNL